MAIEVYDDNGPQTTDNGGDVYSEQDPQVTVHEADGTTASDGTTGGATASTNVSKSNEATATTAPDAPEGATDRQEGEQERQAKNKRQIDDAVMGYDAQISMLDAEAVRLKPETDEQRRKRERREKSKRIIAAVGDGLSALGNLYFTSQYAPNMYNGGLQRATDARIERAKKEREDNNERYLQFSLRSGARTVRGRCAIWRLSRRLDVLLSRSTSGLSRSISGRRLCSRRCGVSCRVRRQRLSRRLRWPDGRLSMLRNWNRQGLRLRWHTPGLMMHRRRIRMLLPGRTIGRIRWSFRRGTRMAESISLARRRLRMILLRLTVPGRRRMKLRLRSTADMIKTGIT